ncbi:MAG: cell division protein FtsA [bacterium]
MAKDEIISGLDIGSDMIRVVVGQKNPNDNSLQVLGAAESPSEGISKGSVTSIEDAVSSISTALERAERMSGLPIESAFVGMTGTHITSQDSHGVIAVAKADGEIKEDDIERVIEAAQAVATPPNFETLHVIPRIFTVDNQEGIKDPVGMTGMRLEVDVQIIQGLSSQIKNLTKSIYRTGIQIDDLVLGILACAEATVTKRQRELGVALVNIGASTTSIVVFEEGDVLHTKILPIGANHVTSDIAIGLRTSIDIAEKIKLEYGSALPAEINKREEIDLSEFEGGENTAVSRKHVAEIIEARTEEMFSMIDKEFQQVDRSGRLPAGVVLTGGGAKLQGIIEVAKNEFRLPASIGIPLNIISAIDKIQEPTFTSAVGLLAWGAGLDNQSSGLSLKRLGSVRDVSGKLKEWFKSFIP